MTNLKLIGINNGGVLYQDFNDERFPGIETEEQKTELVKKLYEWGGEESDKHKGKCKLYRTHPRIMMDWIRNNSGKT